MASILFEAVRTDPNFLGVVRDRDPNPTLNDLILDHVMTRSVFTVNRASSSTYDHSERATSELIAPDQSVSRGLSMNIDQRLVHLREHPIDDLAIRASKINDNAMSRMPHPWSEDK